MIEDGGSPLARSEARTSEPQDERIPRRGSEALVPLGSGQMFDKIAARYDFVNRVLSLGLDQRWRRQVVRSLGLDRKSPQSSWFGERPRVLDVATGTGDLAIAIARACPGATVIGVDPSERMLAIARNKLARRGLAERVTLEVGDAQRLPQVSCSIDAATIAFGIRNVPDRALGLRELARVVRPGGRVAVLELGEPRRGLLGAAARLHTRKIVPRLGGLLSGSREYRYLQSSVAAFPPAEEFAALMETCGLDVLEVMPLTFGVCTLYLATPKEEP